MESRVNTLGVIVSGGFWLAYHEVLRAFEQDTGVAVTTYSGASQGGGPKTIRWHLEQGAQIDVVILSEEGLSELIASGRIATGSQARLASVPLAAAVRLGSPKPDIGSIEALIRTLLAARLVVMPGSTSGLFIRDQMLPRLGLVDRISWTMVPRGTDSTAMLAAGDADLALGPVSELVHQPGIELVGPLPDAVQLVQVFTAAIVTTSRRVADARRLVAFLASDRIAPAIRAFGMEPAGG